MSKSKSKQGYTAVYAGRRLVNNRVYQLFIYAGKELHFRGIVGVYLGGTYRLSSATTIKARPERVEIARVDNPEWEAQDALVDAHNERKRAEAKVAAASKPHIRAAIEALIPLAKNADYLALSVLTERLVREARREASRRKK